MGDMADDAFDWALKSGELDELRERFDAEEGLDDYDESNQYDFRDVFSKKRARRKYKVFDSERAVFIHEEGNMKITAVRYERVCSMGAGTYETERVAAEVSVEDGDSADAALVEARKFVNEALGIEDMSDEELQALKQKVARVERRRR